MSSEPSERARAWVNEHEDSEFVNAESPLCIDMMIAFDAGYSEGEKKGTAVGYLAALREVRQHATPESVKSIYFLLGREWLDRRIREAEENAK